MSHFNRIGLDGEAVAQNIEMEMMRFHLFLLRFYGFILSDIIDQLFSISAIQVRNATFYRFKRQTSVRR